MAVREIVMFDTETNGFYGKSLLSIFAIKAIVDTENKTVKLKDTYDRFYFRNKDEQFNPKAIEVNKLTDEELKKRRKEQNANYPLYYVEDKKSFEKFCEGTHMLIAHNYFGFDGKYYVDFKPKNPWCSMESSPRELRLHKNPKLKELAEFYKVPYNDENLHGAEYDTRVLGNCIYKMIKTDFKPLITILERD